MQSADIPGFFAQGQDLDPADYLTVAYRFECRGDPELAAAHLCSEQSTAQWKRVGVDEDFRPRFGAKVLELRVLGQQPAFSYPVEVKGDGPVWCCEARIAHPHRNFGPRLPNLLSAICGEGTFFSPGIPLLRVLDLEMPEAFLAEFAGPQFGVAGLREMLKAWDRPIFFGVIKPNLGLPPEAFAELGYQSWLGGLDIAKDDEMLADTDWCGLDRRSALLGEARRQAQALTGTPKMYLANITDEVDRLLDLHDRAVANGANALLVNALPVGLSAVRMLRRHSRVPLIAHFPFIAAFSRLPHHGIHSRVMTRLQRLAGFDAIIMPGFGSRMMTPEREVLDCVTACLEPMGPIKPSLPVPGGSDWAGTLPILHDKLGTVDFGFVPGRGVFGHPQGPRGGAASIRQAWEAIDKGISLEEQARTHEELRLALAAFGGRE